MGLLTPNSLNEKYFSTALQIDSDGITGWVALALQSVPKGPTSIPEDPQMTIFIT